MRVVVEKWRLFFLWSVRRVRKLNAIYYHSINGRGRHILPVGYLKILHDRDRCRPSGVIFVILLCACARLPMKHPFSIEPPHSWAHVFGRGKFSPLHSSIVRLSRRITILYRYNTVYILLFKYKFRCTLIFIYKIYIYFNYRLVALQNHRKSGKFWSFYDVVIFISISDILIHAFE